MMFILMSLFLVSHQELILKVSQCTCHQILSLYDCNQLTKCYWNNEDGFCEDRKYTDLDSYCTINSTKCPTNGCTIYQGICTPFSGCSVYIAKTHDECQKISSLCTTNGQNCINIELLCDNFNDNELACQINLDGYPCNWDKANKKCYQIQFCKEIPSSYKTHQTCYEVGQQSMLKCTAKEEGGCMDITSGCSSLSKAGCVFNLEGQSCFWDESQCKELICTNAPSSYNTHQQCQGFLSTCTLNEQQKGCMEIAQNCDIYISEPQCIQSIETACFWYSISCKDGDTNCQTKQECKSWICENAQPSYNNDTLCRQFKSDCTVNQTNNGCIQRLQQCSQYSTQYQCVSVLNDQQICYWNGNSCVDKTCVNAVLVKYNDISCSRYMPQCIAGNNQCILKTCNTYLNENICSNDYQNNQCSWSGYCTQKTCENTIEELTTHLDCQQWLDKCTIKSDLKGCQNLENTCDAYKIQDQCYFAGNPKFQCLWIDGQCIQKNCSTASIDINTDEECLSYLSVCMLSNNKSGCVIRKATCLELQQHQCSITREGTYCFWNGTLCETRQCTQGSYNSFQACKSFLTTCTVNYDQTQYNGCITKQEKCRGYTNEFMCIESLLEGKCIWNKMIYPNSCEARSCQNSDQTTSDEACNNFLNTCTVNYNKTECITRFQNCNQYEYQINCKKTKSGSQCLWVNNQCIDLTCDKADKTYTSHDECQLFNKNCTTNGKGCIKIDQCTTYTTRSGCVIDKNNQLCSFQPKCNLRQCSDAPQSFSTDNQCKTYKSECTTNGNGCVLRTGCADAYIEQACITDSNGNKCTWINNQCVDYNCSSAPSNYVTEFECHMHQPGCTVNQSGGCIIKGLCKDAKVEEACTTDKDGKQCIFSKEGCRDIYCSDIAYSNHDDCANFNPQCTSNGFTCIPQSKCNTKIQSGCFLGSDGPCLWIKNTCYQYSSCTSLQFQTHEQCYDFLNECTTDGNTCIPLDKCEKLPAKGCFQGTDGKCVFDKKCILFKGCRTIEYKTHQECQSLSKNCTTNETKCIELLQDCSSYTKISNCYVNSNQQKCYYDQQTNKCVDMLCSHLNFTNHDECNNALNTCTSDNIKCIKIDKCETYGQNYCHLAPSLDGKCIYDSKDNICRQIKCIELQENCSEISNCVDSGLGCVEFSTCDKYQTQKGCKQGGTDGYCVWNSNQGKGICNVMTKCSDAISNKEACQQKSHACQWTLTLTESTCAQHTCSSKKTETEFCQPILDFSKKYYELCALENGFCISQQMSTLGASNCFQATAFTYTWDSANSACLQCGTVFINKTTNEDNQTNSHAPTMMKAQMLFPLLSLIISIYI